VPLKSPYGDLSVVSVNGTMYDFSLRKLLRDFCTMQRAKADLTKEFDEVDHGGLFLPAVCPGRVP
jgi:predicted heme/steroid binding protein